MKQSLMPLPLLLLALTGCSQRLSPGGEDFSYLKDRPVSAPPVSSKNLLPLAPRNYWEMRFFGEVSQGLDRILVVGPRTVQNTTGTLVHIMRAGKLWRQEVYRQGPEGLQLLAFGDKKQALLELTPPMLLLKETFQESDETFWTGEIVFEKRRYPASAYCRVSPQVGIQTPKGRFRTYRLDSVITMQRPKDAPLFFPSRRWLSPEIGFIQRSFADGGKAVVEVLDSYMVKDH